MNLIEKDDVFSPDPLNENMEKVEEVLSAALTGETAAREEAVADLDARIEVFEAKKLVYGTYVGTGKDQTINLGFTPYLVLVHDVETVREGPSGLMITGIGATTSMNAPAAHIVENGFLVNVGTAHYGFSISNHKFIYLALG